MDRQLVEQRDARAYRSLRLATEGRRANGPILCSAAGGAKPDIVESVLALLGKHLKCFQHCFPERGVRVLVGVRDELDLVNQWLFEEILFHIGVDNVSVGPKH